MGQCQFVGRDADQQKKKKPLRPRKSDDDYVLAISNPVFLDWEHRVKGHWKTAEAKQEYIDNLSSQHQNFPIQIGEHIFISNAQGVVNIEKLQKLGITHILNVGGSSAAWLPEEAYRKAGMQYKLVPDAFDEASYPMLDKHLQDCQDFLTSARSQKDPTGKCVVHCQAGCNRSGVIVAADFMLTNETSVLDTILHCRKCRGNAFLTNPGFQAQLVALARRERRLGPVPGAANCVVETFLWRKLQRERTHG